MKSMRQRRRIAQWLGIAGASLGIVAGVVQATVGAQIPEWTGNKSSPLALGVLTVILSLVALAGGLVLGRTAMSTSRRLAAAVGLLIPGLLCFTTVGSLWYLPGVLLLAASAFALSSGDARETRHFVFSHWLAGALSIVGMLQLMLAVGTGSIWIAAIGIIGGVAVVAAPWVASRRLRLALLLLGAVPFAVLTWWSLASPLLAVIALGLGATLTVRRQVTPAPQEAALLAGTRIPVTTP